MTARLIPELEVEDLDRSLAFYTAVIGCTVAYARPDERFAMLELEGARLMVEEAAGFLERNHNRPFFLYFAINAPPSAIGTTAASAAAAVQQWGFTLDPNEMQSLAQQVGER